MKAGSAVSRTRRAGTTLLAPLVIVGAAHALCEPAMAAEWKPAKPVEIVALNAPGNGSDRIACILVKVLTERQLVPVPVNVVNRPGGGGAVAYNYINQRAGDGHVLALGEDWERELELNFWNSAFMGSNELRKHMARDNEGVKAFLAELGLAR